MRELKKQDSVEAGAQVPEDQTGMPKFSRHLSDIITVTSDTIILSASCTLGTPQAAQWVLLKYDEEVRDDRVNLRVVWGDVQVEIKDARVEDAGKYRLEVRNDKGSAHTECRIRVIDITKAKEYLQRNRVEVINNLELDEMLPYLKQEDVLTMDFAERIKNKETRCDQNDALIDHLLRRKYCDFIPFLTALRKTVQAHIIEMIFPETKVDRRVESAQAHYGQAGPISLTAVILRKSAEILVSSTGLPYFNVVSADVNTYHHVRIYQPGTYSNIEEGITVKFLDLVEKGAGGWAIGKSTIAFSKKLNISADMEEKAPDLPELAPPEGLKRNLADSLLHDETRSIIKARIVQVAPLEYNKMGTLALRKLSVKDESCVARVVLFGEKIERHEFNPGDVIEVDGLYPTTFNGRLQLTATKIAKFQILDGSECTVDITSDDELTDDEFHEESHKATVTIDSFTWIQPCQRCVKPGCARTMRNGSCPRCSGTESVPSFFGEFLYITTQDMVTARITLHSGAMQKLFNCEEFDNAGELRKSVLEKLCVKFNCVIEDDTFTRISKVQTCV